MALENTLCEETEAPLDDKDAVLGVEEDTTLLKGSKPLILEVVEPLGVFGTVTNVRADSVLEVPLPGFCTPDDDSSGLQYPKPVAQLWCAQYSSVLPQCPYMLQQLPNCDPRQTL